MTLGGPTPFRRPPADPLEPNDLWLLKVAIPPERGYIFQHKAVLSYLTFTYSCHVLPSCLQVAFKMAQDRNLGPTWPHLAPSWPHLGSQEAPKRLPRGPQEVARSHSFTIKMSILCGRGSIFVSYPVACNMSPLGSRRGPALRAESGGVRPLCQTPKDLFKQK